MIAALIVPPGRRSISTVQLEPENYRAYAAALGGELHTAAVAPAFARHLDVYTANEPNDFAGPPNWRGSLFVAGHEARGAVLVTGAGGTDVPPGFVKYLQKQKLLSESAST